MGAQTPAMIAFSGKNLREVLLDGRLGQEEALRTAVALCQQFDGANAAMTIEPADVIYGADGQPRVELPKTGDGEVYSAPEVRAGSKATPASQVYNLGVLLFEMLTGLLPLDENSQLSDYRPGLPSEIESITIRALSGDPGHRYSNLNALGQALGAVLEGWTSWERGVRRLPLPDGIRDRVLSLLHAVRQVGWSLRDSRLVSVWRWISRRGSSVSWQRMTILLGLVAWAVLTGVFVRPVKVVIIEHSVAVTLTPIPAAATGSKREMEDVLAGTPEPSETVRPTVTSAGQSAGNKPTATRLWAPEPTAQRVTPSPSPTLIIYIVKPEDSLSGIALAHGTTVEVLSELNGIEPPDYVIISDQELIIPTPTPRR